MSAVDSLMIIIFGISIGPAALGVYIGLSIWYSSFLSRKAIPWLCISVLSFSVFAFWCLHG